MDRVGERALDGGTQVEDPANANSKEQPPGQGHPPQGEAPEEPAQTLHSIVPPDHQDAHNPWCIHSQNKHRVCVA